MVENDWNLPYCETLWTIIIKVFFTYNNGEIKAGYTFVYLFLGQQPWKLKYNSSIKILLY